MYRGICFFSIYFSSSIEIYTSQQKFFILPIEILTPLKKYFSNKKSKFYKIKNIKLQKFNLLIQSIFLNSSHMVISGYQMALSKGVDDFLFVCVH